MENINKFAYEIVKEINLARTKPKKYAKFLEEMLKYFDGDYLIYPKESINTKTNEGAEAYEEAIEYLYNTYPKPKINLHLSLFKIANDYLNHSMKINYENIFKLNINDLIEKYGNFNGNFCKLMDFGGLTAKSIVTNLIVCDGEESRDYRNLIFDDCFRYIGVASKSHPNYKQFTVLMISENFKSLDSKNDIPIQISDKVNEEDEEEENEEEEDNEKEENKKEDVEENEELENKNNYNDDIKEEGVKSIKKIEQIKNINGKFMKVTKVIKTFDDGYIETEIFKEQI